MSQKAWSKKSAESLYHIRGWGEPYFGIGQDGQVQIYPTGNVKKSIALKTLTDQVVERGISTPFLLRFNDILTHRLQAIHKSFHKAIKNFEYQGDYTTIYPIKVNQQRHIVEHITKTGPKSFFGLEAGSKPELLAVLALADSQDMPIVCNGYKDKEFFEIALMGTKVGKTVFPVIEKFSEFETMVEVAKELDVKPQFGLRVKLSSSGSGKWQSSGGHRSKFGLSISELLRGIRYLDANDLTEGLQLLHFHLGSQITDIKAIKKALKEAAHVYVELKKRDLPLKYFDVGGGLGVDYDGSRSRQDNSMNYTLQEYANDVVFQVQEICDQAEVEHPHIFTECGRAVSAYHSVLVMDVLGRRSYDRIQIQEGLPEKAPLPLKELFAIREEISRENILEYYHDAISAYQECLNLFSLGYLTIKERSLAEDIYFNTMIRCRDFFRKMDDVPEALEKLEEELADTYFCNFSVFQSLPDYWAIEQKFPIMPIDRLLEEPTRLAKLVDISCDSDGKVDSFIDPVDGESSLIRLHENKTDEEYYLGVFLVGAYQETLGDLHNLFGDTNAVHVSLDKSGKPLINSVVKGDTVKEVLSYVQYDIEDLVNGFHKQLEKAVSQDLITIRELGKFHKFYELALEGYTYLEDIEAREEF